MSAHARKDDPWTSHEAAGTVRTETIREAVKAIFIRHAISYTSGNIHQHGLTDEELVGLYLGLVRLGKAPMATEQGIRSRRAELAHDGVLIIDSKEIRKTKTGRNARVWRLTD